MVALFTRAWIEIMLIFVGNVCCTHVALFTRAWIEIACCQTYFAV